MSQTPHIDVPVYDPWLGQCICEHCERLHTREALYRTVAQWLFSWMSG